MNQYNVLAFLQWCWRLWLALVLSAPFLAAAWVCLSATMEGAPEPAWWIAFESAIGVTR
jgi:hypothetical protein